MRPYQKPCFILLASFLFLFSQLTLLAQEAAASLVFTSPKNGTHFQSPATILLEVVAVDKYGDIRRVEFFANGKVIGVSEHLTRDAIIPGKPRLHVLEWRSPQPGSYRLIAKAADSLGKPVVSPAVEIVVEPSTPGEILLPRGSQWRYYNRPERPAPVAGTSWQQANYDTTAWLFGPGPLGYGDPFIKTRTEAAERSPRPVTGYFRTFVDVADPSKYKSLHLRLVRDDGAIVYLNGVEVVRNNMPSGVVSHETLASASAGETQEGSYLPFQISAAQLLPGKNLIAVEVHQVAVASSDLSFDLEISGSSEEPVNELPTVSLSTPDPDAKEPGIEGIVMDGTFQISRSGPTDRPLTVLLTYGGTATMGADYFEVTREVVINEGSNFANIEIIPWEDELLEQTETVTATIVETAISRYKINPEQRTGTIRIENAGTTTPEPPVVSIVAAQEQTSEPSPTSRIIPGRFVLSRTGSTANGLVVYLKASGTATPGADYTPLGERVEFPTGSSTVELFVFALQDALIEADETVVLTIISPTELPSGTSPPYLIAPDRDSATVIIHDTTVFSGATIEITSPRLGTIFTNPPSIQINAVAIDPGGYIPRLEFYANERLIGVSEVIFIREPDPGTPIHHTFEWLNPPAGRHILTAKGVTSKGAVVVSPPVEITVVGDGEPKITTVRIFASDEEATEFDLAVSAIDPAVFTFWRDGDLVRDLRVFFSVKGTAVNGKDYRTIGNSVLIPSGQHLASIEIVPLSSDETEPIETVVIKLEPSPVLSPLPQYELQDTNRVASAIIYDRSRPLLPKVVLAYPTDGEHLEAGRDVQLIAHAYHPSEEAGVVIFRNGHTIIGRSEIHLDRYPNVGLITHGIVWTSPPTGIHNLSAILTPFSNNVFFSNTNKVTVGDLSNHSPVVQITKPLDGSIFHEGSRIEIEVIATDADSTDPNGNSIHQLELFADGSLLVRTNVPKLVHVWENAKPGPHSLFAKAVDVEGAVGRSPEVRIMVIDPNELSFVRRTLPANYLPGQPFIVKLTATPFPGTSAYGFQDRPPQGWSVDLLSHGGVFDPATGWVKFGPFLDGQNHEVQYRLTSPSTAYGIYEFGGTSAANSREYPISGQRLVQSGDEYHPADTNKDHRIVLLELISYASSWKEGHSWPIGPNPIPLDYVTRAGFLWKKGEAYSMDLSAGAPPSCWIPTSGKLALLAANVERSAIRTITPLEGGALEVTVTLTPQTATTAYGLIEHVGSGWNVSSVSEEGRFDLESRTIRWGLFLDGQPRQVRYRLTPISDIIPSPKFAGFLSADGTSSPVIPGNTEGSNPVSSAISLSDVKASAEGEITIQLNAPKGQTCIVEKSFDLLNWVPIAPFFLPDGVIQISEENNQAGCFYRIRTP